MNQPLDALPDLGPSRSHLSLGQGKGFPTPRTAQRQPRIWPNSVIFSPSKPWNPDPDLPKDCVNYEWQDQRNSWPSLVQVCAKRKILLISLMAIVDKLIIPQPQFGYVKVISKKSFFAWILKLSFPIMQLLVTKVWYFLSKFNKKCFMYFRY